MKMSLVDSTNVFAHRKHLISMYMEIFIDLVDSMCYSSMEIVVNVSLLQISHRLPRVASEERVDVWKYPKLAPGTNPPGPM